MHQIYYSALVTVTGPNMNILTYKLLYAATHLYAAVGPRIGNTNKLACKQKARKTCFFFFFLETTCHDLSVMTNLINKNKCYIHDKTIIKDILVHNMTSVPEKKHTCSTC